MGVPRQQMSQYLGINQDTLRKYYRSELDHAELVMNSAVFNNMFSKAVHPDDHDACTIFWMKARMGWKETKEDQLDRFIENFHFYAPEDDDPKEWQKRNRH